MSLVTKLPRELKQELSMYCCRFAFVLDKTGLFPVIEDTAMSNNSRLSLCKYAENNGYWPLCVWALENNCKKHYWDPYDKWDFKKVIVVK